MIRFTSVIPVIVLALLTGCASLKDNAGFDYQLKTAQATETRSEPGDSVVLMGHLHLKQEIAVAVVNLPTPLPLLWKQELVDKGRTYTVKGTDGKMLEMPLARVVVRAIAYTQEGRFVELFDAVVTTRARSLMILLPADRAEELMQYQFALVPSDASWLMTTQTEMVTLNEGQGLKELPKGFFEEHPSPLRQVITISREDKVFQELLEMFPERLKVYGVPYSGRPNATVVISQFSRVTGLLDRGISCGSAVATSGPLAPIAAAASVGTTIYAMGQKDCLAVNREK